MKIRYEQLETHCQQSLAPVYLVSGDEPFQSGEACRIIREQARAQGVTEREVFHVDRSFDWDHLTASAGAMSLFAERKLIEVRVPTGKPGDAGAKALIAYAESASPDNILLVISGKLEAAQQRSKWFTALDKVGVTVTIWPVESARLPQWIQQRLQLRGLQPTPEAVRLLAERVEGNLLAADQEMEKLLLLNGPGKVDVAQVMAAVADSARYDAFSLIDAALAGDARRTCRILFGLLGEGVEPMAILGAMIFQIRSLCAMAADQAAGEPLEQVLASHRVWDKRKPLLRAALQRHNLLRWQGILWRAGEIDRMIKGLSAGRSRDELLQLCLRMAGVVVTKARPAA
ncbi:MAG: DNA polymerase III subunit delta [Gammaproteobacteria bacterium]|nr:DNA polymerase III subunit delta [Gammaproteobacteria bacterium]MDH5653674.1 DNA polymerase III subunit delta [Gammaproteobacteria bacterium]